MAAIGQTLPPGRNLVNVSPQPILRFLKGQPKALGTVQIMIGVITLVFGIVLVSDPQYAPASVLTGNVYWASIVYIIAGSLSVAAENNLNSCLVKGSLGMNVVSAVFSAVGIGVLTTDLFLYYYCNSYEDCYRFMARSKAISGVLLVFAFLQFIISISISAFACKATCCSDMMVPVVMYGNQAATGNPQVSVLTIPNQAVNSNPQNVVYPPQAQVNNPVSQNVYEWTHRR
ncbi:membrane-spanning 4-domains subfamily A member 4A [Pangasianodon hypophthalmus]|uniref:membrane-spanning 4-domains subfamily A member 4A n=1 Tax=Pangasianodon hypophthalmus TaxID=310915 RepID=UPI000F007F85|nr:membrane-spanning 4-domains subfamily A member 4A [Pangasianodon hypophthalmus]